MFNGKSQYNSAIARDANSKYKNNSNNVYISNNANTSTTNKGNHNAFRTHGSNPKTNDGSVRKINNNHYSNNANYNDDDDNAPPIAMSARTTTNTTNTTAAAANWHEEEEQEYSRKFSRGGNASKNTEKRSSTSAASNTQWPRHDKPQANKRLREHTESFTSASKFPNTHSGSAPMPVSSETKTSATKMLTVLNEKETELPQKLNTKVFVDGLPYRYDPEPGQPTLEDELAQFVSAWKVGKVIRLIKKPGHGFGFLVFKSPNSVPVAIKVLHGRKFLGRPLRVALPKPRDLEAMNDVAGMKDMGKTSFKRQVLLSDLPKVCQPEIVREVLRDVAPQLESKLETIKMTSRNRKAFLTFASEAEVPSAIQFLNGFHLLGRKIAAVAAAPPGSLPFSHSQQIASANATIGNANSEDHNIKQNEVDMTGAQKLSGSGNNNKNSINNTNAPLNKYADEHLENDDNDVAIVPLGAEVSVMRKLHQGSSMQRNTQSYKEKILQGTEHKMQTQTTGANRAGNGTVTSDAPSQIANKNRTVHTLTNARSNVTGQTDKYNLLDDGPAEVYVGNLNENVTVNDLRVHFASCGKINHVELLAHPETHLPLGIARVTFAIPAYAAYAVSKLHGSRLHDCAIRVDRGEESSAPLSHERQSKLDSLLEHAAHIANTKKPIDINAIEKQNKSDSDEEEIDEVGFMAHHGIHNPEEYFKDTTVRFASIDKKGKSNAIEHDTEEQDRKGKQIKKTNANNTKTDSITNKKRLPEETKTFGEVKRQRSNSSKNDISKNEKDCNVHEHKELQKLKKNNEGKRINSSATANNNSKGSHNNVSGKNKKLRSNVVIIDDDNGDHDNQNEYDDDGVDYDKVALTGMLASDSESEEEHFVDADTITPERQHKKKLLTHKKMKSNKGNSKKEKNMNVKKSISIKKRNQSNIDKVAKIEDQL